MSDIQKNKELCEKYPFLIPRNLFTDKIPDDYNYSWTYLDNLEPGWKIAFGEQLCKELKEALKKAGYVDNFRFSQIKEKYGQLCLYNLGCNQEAWDVIHKYEKMSKRICGRCGKPATKIGADWIYPYCDDCAKKMEYGEFFDIDEYYNKEEWLI